jgi:hypothetical protein
MERRILFYPHLTRADMILSRAALPTEDECANGTNDSTTVVLLLDPVFL